MFFVILSLDQIAVSLSEHVNGCRVVQAVIECFGDELDVMKLCAGGQHLKLATTQYGNYVVQCIIKRGEWYSNLRRIELFRDRFISDVFTLRHLQTFSVKKSGSHVIESCIRVANGEQLDTMIAAVQRNKARLLRVMMFHQVGNYVVRTLLEHCSRPQQEALVHVVHRHVVNLNQHTRKWGDRRVGSEIVGQCRDIKRRMSVWDQEERRNGGQ